MTTILVGVDSSERSLDAIAFTHQIAAASGATVLVANVFPYDDHPSRMANLGFRKVLENDSLAIVHRLGAEFADLGEDRVRTAAIPRSSAARGLHDLGEAEHPALTVVGSSHVGTIGRVTPGSTAERLLHGAASPVAVVPKDYRTDTHEIRSIGVAYDGSPESEVALRSAADAARTTGATLRVIRVLDTAAFGTPALMAGPSSALVPSDVAQRARKLLDDAIAGLPSDVSAEAVFVDGDPAFELTDQTETLDLLVTGSRGYGPLRAVMTGGVTGRLLRDAKCPVIVLPRGVESPLGKLFASSAETAV
jgi:nucleotide-binding universal stress UspA family protein